jgi:hypothetical protein
MRESVANDSRNNMVQSAAALIGSQGLNATSFSDVLWREWGSSWFDLLSLPRGEARVGPGRHSVDVGASDGSHARLFREFRL